jgi:hypothetical protein
MGILTGYFPNLIIAEAGVIISALANPVTSYVVPVSGNVLLLSMTLVPSGTATSVNLNLASSIILALQYPDMINTAELPMTSSSDGNSALRTTLDTDFPYVGDYLLELIVTIGSEILKSSPITLHVGGFL